MSSVIDYAISESTLPDIVYIEDGNPSGTFEQAVEAVSEVAANNDSVPEYIKSLYEEVYPKLYNPQNELFPLYYLMFRRKHIKQNMKPNEGDNIFQIRVDQSRYELFDGISKHFKIFRFKESGENFDQVYSWDKIDDFEKTYIKKLKDFLSEQKTLVKPREELDKVVSTLDITAPYIIKAFLTYEYKTANLDIQELFNKAVVSQTIPFLTCSPFYKVYEGSKIYSEWDISNPSSIIGYVKVKEEERLTSYSQFEITETQIRIESFDNINIKQACKKTLDLIRDVFPLQIKMEYNEDEKHDEENTEKVINQELYVECYFPNIDYHQGLFKQFITCNPIIRHFYYLDESSFISRKKTYLLMNYYRNPQEKDEEPVTMYISNKFIESQSSVPYLNLEPNRCHTRLYIKRCTTESLSYILEDISRCMYMFLFPQGSRPSIQDSLYTELSEIFPKQTIDDSAERECKVVGKRVSKKSEFEEIWGPVLNRSIRPVQYPQIIDKIDQATHFLVNPDDTDNPLLYKDQIVDGKQHVLVFPPLLYANKIPQRFYTCNPDHEFGYIGLREVDKIQGYPEYIPYCYKESQYDKKISNLSSYLKGESKSSAISSYEIETGKILMHEQYGTLLGDVEQFISLARPSYRLSRYGTLDFEKESTPSFGIPREYSGLSILYLLEYYINDIEPSDLDIEKVKRSLIDKINTYNVYLTEAFRYTKKEMTDIVESNRFIDPRLFYHILKDMYSCELFMFTKDEKQSKSPFYLTCSYFYNDYADFRYEVDKFLMIAINKGSEFDSYNHPICEYVLERKLDEKDPSKSKFNTEHPLYKIFNTAINELYGRKSLYHSFTKEPIAQSLNSHGKVSWLHFKEGERLVSLRLHVPIHSIEVDIIDEKSFTTPLETVTEFLRDLQSKQDNLLIAENRKNGNIVGIYLKVTKGKKEYRYYIPIDKDGEDESFYMYRFYEKISRILLEYTYYLFSIFMKKNELLPPDIEYEHFKIFSNTSFIVDPSVKYKLLSREWQLLDNPMIDVTKVEEDTRYKIVVQTESTRVKLMYMLRQKLFMNPDQLMEYSETKYMSNYYVNITDFTPQINTIVFENAQNLEKYQQRIDKTLDEGEFEVNPNATKPYMLYKLIPELSHHTFVMQPALSLEHAIYTCDAWNKLGVNKTGLSIKHPCTQFLWKSAYDYTVFKQEGGERHLVAVFYNGEKVIYQSILPYKVI